MPWSSLELPCQLTPALGCWKGEGEALSPDEPNLIKKKGSLLAAASSICVSYGPVAGICARPEGWGRGGRQRTDLRTGLGSVCICWLQDTPACTRMHDAMEGSQNPP